MAASKHAITLDVLGVSSSLEEGYGAPVTWVARFPIPGVQPFRCTDKKLFLETVVKFMKRRPKLKVYIFKVVNGHTEEVKLEV